MRGLNGSRWGDSARPLVTHWSEPLGLGEPPDYTACGLPTYRAIDVVAKWEHVTCQRCLRCHAARERRAKMETR
jgi:hypothetical protein